MDSSGVVEPPERVSFPSLKTEEPMVRPDLGTWGHTLDELRHFTVNAQHPRSREPLLTLYMMASRQTHATPGQPTSGASRRRF